MSFWMFFYCYPESSVRGVYFGTYGIFKLTPCRLNSFWVVFCLLIWRFLKNEDFWFFLIFHSTKKWKCVWFFFILTLVCFWRWKDFRKRFLLLLFHSKNWRLSRFIPFHYDCGSFLQNKEYCKWLLFPIIFLMKKIENSWVVFFLKKNLVFNKFLKIKSNFQNF